MSNIKTQEKSRNLKLRLTELEYSFIKEKADEAHLTISDYQRCKLFDESNIKTQKSDANHSVDSKARFACDHDRELMRLAYSTYMFTRELLLIVHGAKVYQDIVEQAQLRLKEWGYEDE